MKNSFECKWAGSEEKLPANAWYGSCRVRGGVSSGSNPFIEVESQRVKVVQHALRGQLLVLGLPDPLITVYQRREVESGSRFYPAGSQRGNAVSVGSYMLKEKKPTAKQKEKRIGSGNLPVPELIPGLPAIESNKDKSNKDEKQRIPVPPGEMPPLPIYAPPEPGYRVPVYF